MQTLKSNTFVIETKDNNTPGSIGSIGSSIERIAFKFIEHVPTQSYFAKVDSDQFEITKTIPAAFIKEVHVNQKMWIDSPQPSTMQYLTLKSSVSVPAGWTMLDFNYLGVSTMTNFVQNVAFIVDTEEGFKGKSIQVVALVESLVTLTRS